MKSEPRTKSKKKTKKKQTEVGRSSKAAKGEKEAVVSESPGSVRSRYDVVVCRMPYPSFVLLARYDTRSRASTGLVRKRERESERESVKRYGRRTGRTST